MLAREIERRQQSDHVVSRDVDQKPGVRRLLHHFDPQGRLVRWPPKVSQQQLCLWVLWARLPAHQVMTEREINQQLTAAHGFGDYALLRRWLCDYGMVSRTRDGREYRRVEQRPPADALALIRRLTVTASGAAA